MGRQRIGARVDSATVGLREAVSIDGTGQLKPVCRACGAALRSAVRVELRRDATFSDGTPVTEEDVVRRCRRAFKVTPSKAD